MKSIYKSILSVSAAAIVMAGTLAPVMVNAWGDSDNGRPSYTLEQINKGELKDTITFNSISNGKIGDEKNFVGAKVAGAEVSTWNANTINVKDGETYTIRLFVHNNSPKGMEAIAKGVKATFSIPTTVAKSQTIIGYIDSSNATPKRYWDEVTLNADEDVYLEYVDGSAKYTNNKGTFKLSNDVIISGATLGYTSMNGEIPGCYEYSGVVTIDVKVHSSVAAKVSKTVRIKGTKTWSEAVDAKVGDEVEYQIEYKNLLAETVNDVMIRDVLPTNVEYVNDTTYLYNANYQSGVKLADNTVTTSGINIGSYSTKGNAYVRFTGKVVDKTLACGSNQLVNWASATVKKSVYKDDASVMVKKDDESCHEKPTPTPTPTPEPTPETPEELPNTGAGTIVTGAVGAGAVVTTLGYFVASRKKFVK
ncbi:MAG: LPXTG cell wall anchor domain-containing protein [Candidatus Saccharibacteria bacterium]|nr:LPXTG cell wall anchor domain-containing protein [Candidatus Saccharibacteria bacterium]